jgi:hypothetical protein
MSTPSQLLPEVRALLDRERVVPPVSALQRARAIARARASLATSGTAIAASSGVASQTRWLAAAAAVLVLGAAVAAAAYELRARWAPARFAAPAHVTEVVASVPVTPPPAVSFDEITPATAPTIAVRSPLQAGAARGERRLLLQARAFVARGDFAAALIPISEHTRQFKNGRLVEEREALRVKALAGLGRTDDARRAVAAFQARFPRSVLLPAVSRMPTSAP